MAGSNDSRNTLVVRVDADCARFIEEMSDKTRMNRSTIASEAIRFAMKYAKLVPVECWDVIYDDMEFRKG